MNLSARALSAARETAAGLLEQLGVEAYLYEVEPREGPWEVRVECANADGWQSVLLTVQLDRLLAARSNGAERARLLADWGERLAACRRPPPERTDR